MDNFRVFRSNHYSGKLVKLDNSKILRAKKIEQALKERPFSGKPLGYKFFREKKFNGDRLIFLVYEEYKCIFLITITDKRVQQQEIDLIKSNLDMYEKELKSLLDRFRLLGYFLLLYLLCLQLYHLAGLYRLSHIFLIPNILL